MIVLSRILSVTVIILARKLLEVKGFVSHSTVNLNRCKPLLHCAACPARSSGSVGLHRTLGYR